MPINNLYFIGAVILLLIILFMLFKKYIVRFIIYLLNKIFKITIQRKVIIETLSIFKFKIILWLTLSTIVFWGLHFLQIFFIARILGITLNYLTMFFILSLVTVIAALPITIVGIGTREFALINILAAYGVSREESLALSLMIYTILLLNVVFASVIWQIEHKKDEKH